MLALRGNPTRCTEISSVSKTKDAILKSSLTLCALGNWVHSGMVTLNLLVRKRQRNRFVRHQAPYRSFDHRARPCCHPASSLGNLAFFQIRRLNALSRGLRWIWALNENQYDYRLRQRVVIKVHAYLVVRELELHSCGETKMIWRPPILASVETYMSRVVVMLCTGQPIVWLFCDIEAWFLKKRLPAERLKVWGRPQRISRQCTMVFRVARHVKPNCRMHVRAIGVFCYPSHSWHGDRNSSRDWALSSVYLFCCCAKH